MGCSHSAAYDKITTHPRFAEWMEKFGALQISKSEALKLYAVFHRADLDGGGTINLLELLTVIDLERTPFTKRVFSIFDDDGSGDIDFGEFVLALWNYCTLSKVSLAMFAFDLYDRDSTGILETHDLDSMVKDIYGKAAGSSHYAKQVAKELAELEAKGEVGLDQFLEFSRTHHSLLWPAFQMQLALKKKMMGVGFWQTHAERRVKLSKNKYMKIKDLLQLHAKGQIDTAVDASLAPQTQVLLESIGTKADRRARQQKAQESVLFEGKSKKEQEFLKNYITGDYNMAAATMTKQQRQQQQQQQAAATAAAAGKPSSNGSASAKYAVDATADLSSKSGSGDNHDHDFPAMSVSSSATAGAGSTSAKTLTGKKKSMVVGGTGGGNNILQTVLEDINAKEKEAALQDELDEQAQAQQFKNKLKNIVKPAQDMSQLQHQQQEKRASFLQSSMQALGMDTQVIQHVANTPSTKGPITINTNKVAASSTPSMSALVANSHHEAGSLQNTRASWFGGTTASSRVVPTSNVSAKVGGSTSTATNTASSVISPRSSVKMTGGSASSAGGATSALSPSSSMFASSGGTGTAVPIDPIAMLLSPSANGAAGSPDRRGSMRPNMAAMEPSDSNNATVNLMATHKKRAQQRRASVG